MHREYQATVQMRWDASSERQDTDAAASLELVDARSAVLRSWARRPAFALATDVRAGGARAEAPQSSVAARMKRNIAQTVDGLWGLDDENLCQR